MAVIEIVSPGNKSSKAAIRSFVDKAVQFLHQGVHLLIIDLFPPTPATPRACTRSSGTRSSKSRSRFHPTSLSHSRPIRPAR